MENDSMSMYGNKYCTIILCTFYITHYISLVSKQVVRNPSPTYIGRGSLDCSGTILLLSSLLFSGLLLLLLIAEEQRKGDRRWE